MYVCTIDPQPHYVGFLLIQEAIHPQWFLSYFLKIQWMQRFKVPRLHLEITCEEIQTISPPDSRVSFGVPHCWGWIPHFQRHEQTHSRSFPSWMTKVTSKVMWFLKICIELRVQTGENLAMTQITGLECISKFYILESEYSTHIW